MLTEEQLIRLPLQIQGYFSDLESNIIAIICEHIREIGEITITDVHRLAELQKIGYNIERIEKAIAETLSLTQDEVYKAFYESSRIDYESEREIFKSVGRELIPFAENMPLQNLIEEISKVTAEEFTNITRTTGFVTANGTFQPMPKYYQGVVDKAVMQVRAGQTDFNSAMRATVREMADKGHSFVQYDNEGKRPYRRRVDSSVRNAMMGAQQKLSQEQAEIVAKKMGADGFEISYHRNPRPSHVWFAGEQFSKEDFDKRVRPLMEEYNCYHRAYAIILGISPRTYSEEELAALKARDEEKHEYKGKSYSGYEATQVQRKLETSMRRQKDRILAFEKSGDDEQVVPERALLRRYQKEYKSFSEAVELPRSPARVKVNGFGRDQAARARRKN